MDTKIPDYVLNLWDKGAFHKTTLLIQSISVDKGSKLGSETFPNKGFGNRTVIGLALNAADGTAKGGSGKSTTDADLLLYAQCQLMHLSFVDSKGLQIVEKIPLTMLIPPAGQLYVPIYLEDFNPGKSSIEWSETLGNTDPVEMELVVFCL